MWNINVKKANTLSRNYKAKNDYIQRTGSLFNYEIVTRAQIKYSIKSKSLNKFQTNIDLLKNNKKPQISLTKYKLPDKKTNNIQNFFKKNLNLKSKNSNTNIKNTTHKKYITNNWNHRLDNLKKETEKKLNMFYSTSTKNVINSKNIKIEKKNLDTLNLSKNVTDNELSSKANSFISPRSIIDFQELSDNIKENKPYNNNNKKEKKEYIKLNFFKNKIKDDVRYNFYSKFKSVLESIQGK